MLIDSVSCVYLRNFHLVVKLKEFRLQTAVWGSWPITLIFSQQFATLVLHCKCRLGVRVGSCVACWDHWDLFTPSERNSKSDVITLIFSEQTPKNQKHPYGFYFCVRSVWTDPQRIFFQSVPQFFTFLFEKSPFHEILWVRTNFLLEKIK